MTAYKSTNWELLSIPDNLTIPQFFFDTHHHTRPKKDFVWLIDDQTGRKVGYERIRSRTFAIANGVSRQFGIVDGDVVCIYSPNDIDYPPLVWAFHRLGATITCANPGYTVSELAHQIRITKPRILIVHPVCLSVAQQAAKQCGLSSDHIILLTSGPEGEGSSFGLTLGEIIDDGISHEQHFQEARLLAGEGKSKLAFLSFSSGTTGQAKAVAISHYAVIANVIQMAAHNKLCDPVFGARFAGDAVATGVLPFFHIYGLVVNIHFLLYAGVTLVVIPKFQYQSFLKSIVQHRITHLYIVPPQMVLFCKHPATRDYNLNHIRFAMSGAAPLSDDVMQLFHRTLPNCSFGQGYGMTETTATVSMIPPDQQIGTSGSAGQIIPGVTCRVVRPDGSLAGVGEQGELQVQSPSNALYYLGDEKATQATFLPDNWVRTGDEVKIDENGEIFILDRIKEIIKVRGYQVAPAELEGHLLTHADVANVCVVSLLDEYSGEVPKAYVVLESSAAERVRGDPNQSQTLSNALAQLVADHKSAYKHLKGGVEFIEEIPTSPSGKALRRVLRDRARAQMLIRAKL